MKVGDLVRITRASIAVPKNSIGLIVKVQEHTLSDDDGLTYTLFHVQLLNGPLRRYLIQDLKLIN